MSNHYYLLDKIQKVNDIKDIPREEYQELARQIRAFLIEKLSKTGGHLASNLGCVELTMALHLCLDLPKDKIIWDVGHQSYTHKILTGRQKGFDEIRKYGGMSGFPKRKESHCDAFDTGHSSTSISAGLGYAYQSQITGDDNTIVSVIGDGALTGGMAYEALNNAASLKRNFIVILNDNSMSISPNVGGMSKYLGDLRINKSYTRLKKKVHEYLNKMPTFGKKIAKHIQKTKESIKQLMIPGMFFENMGTLYLGPVDGHNLNELIQSIQMAKQVNQSVLIHVITTKGKGYQPAEKEPESYHGVGPFEVKTGKHLSTARVDDYSAVFGKKLVEMARENENIVAITAAMPSGTGLNKFAKEFPNRFFDVGIAEAHGVTFAAGLAAAGLKPYFAVYSSFLQRGFDQLIHDVCIQNLPVTLCVDRGGLVGSDGETHQGIFDLSYLSLMPNMSVMAPKNSLELEQMLEFSLKYDQPLSIRYPRGNASHDLEEFNCPLEYGKAEVIYEEEDICLLCVGTMTLVGDLVRADLKEMGYNATLVNLRFVKPLDESLLLELPKEHKLIVVIEENVEVGGVYQRIAAFYQDNHLNINMIGINLKDDYIEHGDVSILHSVVGMDKDSMTKKIVSHYLNQIS